MPVNHSPKGKPDNQLYNIPETKEIIQNQENDSIQEDLKAASELEFDSHQEDSNETGSRDTPTSSISKSNPVFNIQEKLLLTKLIRCKNTEEAMSLFDSLSGKISKRFSDKVRIDKQNSAKSSLDRNLFELDPVIHSTTHHDSQGRYSPKIVFNKNQEESKNGYTLG
jgi:hypothetical protein